jgi:alkylation response protein AidB-like acyl-CoA dehydrogenase
MSASDSSRDEERMMLRDAARRFVERDYPFEARRAALARPEGFSRERWSRFAEMGWLALGLPEDCDGIGDPIDQAIVAQALGSACAVEPWLAQVGLCAPLLCALRDATPGGCEPAAQWLRALAAGERLLALAAWEPQGRYDAHDVTTRATPAGDGWRLDGVKTLVLSGAAADALLVVARESGGPRDRDGLSVFLVPADAAGLARRGLPTYDGRQTADLRLREVRVPSAARLGPAGAAWPALEVAIDHATALACEEAVGTMQWVLDTTRAYLQQRRQFGRALASNQVLRHRLVDLYVDIEQARAISDAAVGRLADEPALRRRAVSLAKAFVSPAARRCGEEGIQLHGAIGMTDETAIGHAAKRLVALANLFGDEAWHLERLAPA